MGNMGHCEKLCSSCLFWKVVAWNKQFAKLWNQPVGENKSLFGRIEIVSDETWSYRRRVVAQVARKAVLRSSAIAERKIKQNTLCIIGALVKTSKPENSTSGSKWIKIAKKHTFARCGENIGVAEISEPQTPSSVQLKAKGHNDWR